MKKFLLLALLLTFSTSLFAKKNMAWRIESEKSRIYVLGSIHVADSSIYPLDNKVLKAFDSSSTLFLEVDISKVDPMKLVMKAFYTDETQTLKKNVSAKYYKMFCDAFDSLGYPASYYNKFRPWFAAMTYSQLEYMGEGMASALGVDQYFSGLADSLHKKIAEMETIEKQISLLESFDDKIDAFMEYSVKSEGVDSPKVADLLASWKNGDDVSLDKLINMIDTNDKNSTFIMEKLMFERNNEMTAKIADFLDKGEPKIYFIVVGAGHVIGERGIVKQLEKMKKYKIERL